MFHFDPIPESELNKKSDSNDSWKNLQEGPISFVIKGHSINPNGNVKVQFTATDEHGNYGRFSDTFSNNAQWKILEFLKSIGKPEIYEVGQINFYSLVGCKGVFVLRNKEWNGKVSLQISSYVQKDDSVVDEDDDSDIPF